MHGWSWVVGLGVLSMTVPGLAASPGKVKSKPAAAARTGDSPYRAAILVDAASGAVLFEKDGHQQAPPASMTKLMLMLLVAEGVRDGKLHWDDPIMASARSTQMGGSQVYLKQGEVFPLSEMMQAIVIHSANDAAVAVAEAVAGSTGAFVERMNGRARQLGMKDTVYQSVHGLPPEAGRPSDLSSPADLAVLAREVVQFPEILKLSSTREATFRDGTLILTNTNRLVRETDWVDGLKTGYTREAGFNVTATAQRDGMRLIAVVMGAPQKADCFAEAARLLNRGFSDYQAMSAVREGDVVANDVAVQGGKPRFVRVVAGRTLRVLARRGQKHAFQMQLSLEPRVAAPLSAKQVVGEVVVRDGESVVGTVPALAADAVERASLWDRVF